MDNLDTSIDGIAIIGMAGRFPGARNIEQFWHNLRDGVESISFFTDEELEAAGIEPALLNAPNYVKAGAVLEDIDLFDASFFGFNPREAALTDPQHRFFLECAWEAMESAGYDSERYDGAIGVYAGVGMNSYLLNLYTNREMTREVSAVQVTIGNDKDHLPTRVSYKMNLRGPSMAVQTACSTSLVAVHLACQSLHSYQCDMALAGGVSIAPHKSGYLYQEGGIFSPDGHCRAFDAKAQGTVGGSGAGVVVLKRLADALADGDRILAVIKGSAINNDGAVKVGYTAPSVKGQVEVITMAQDLAEVDPRSISYIETHGTGTLLGDPIEFEALNQAFRASTEDKGFCAIGSLKTNVGHLDTAAGVAGLIKTVLALQHKQLPPSLHFTAPNPQIDFPNSPFFVNTTLTEWKNGSTPRRAGVSSFGIGGTNAHLVVEEAPPVEVVHRSRRPQLLLLSAKTDSALEQTTNNLMAHLERDTDVNLADVAYTLQVGRRSFSHRKSIVCDDVENALMSLAGQAADGVATGMWEGGPRAVALMFPGQGTQYVNMGLGLYEVEPKFREVIDECAEAFQSHLGIDLREVLYPRAHERDEALQKLDQTAFAQPALFSVEYALAQMWMQWGGEPQAMIGHSLGEYVAACVAGVFSLKEAVRLIAVRGRLMQQRDGGAMLVVPLGESEVKGLCAGRGLAIAAVNGPRQCVVSGAIADVEAFEAELSERKIAGKRLPGSHAFHSAMMDPILDEFANHVRQTDLKPPRIPFISCVTGTWIAAEEATDANYWARQLRAPVRFADGMRELMKDGDRVLLEMGPGHTLSRLIKQQAGNDSRPVVAMMRRADEGASDEKVLLRALGQLWVVGAAIDWARLHTGEQRRRVALPTYPFERQRYWIDRRTLAQQTQTPSSVLQKSPDVADWFYVPSWNRSTTPPTDHEVSRWLIFVDEYGLASRIIKGLEQLGHDVVGVMAGERFAKLAESLYTINPTQRDDYDALLTDLQAHDKSPHKIAHCWSVCKPQMNADERGNVRSFEQEQDLGFYSLLYLAQALGKQLLEQASGGPGIVNKIELKVVTSNVQEVTGEELLCPEKATVLGPCKVIPQEYPNVTCCSIDVVIPEAGTPHEERLIDQLTNEFAGQSTEMVVAYRGGHRWVQRFESVRLDKQETIAPLLRERGVYLITGGVGGIGLELAEYLVQTVQAKLVLVGRSGLPEREQWDEWVETHDAHDEVSRKIVKVKRLEEMGGEVMVGRADVTDEAQMHDVLSRVSSRFGDVHGVIHSAGLPPSGLIQLKTPEMCAKVMAPKVQGTLVLDQIFKDTKLDFLILNSSVRAFLGVPGGVDYAAANCFLDLFAHARRDSAHLTMSINWDGWQEVGMSVDTLQKEPSSEELILSAEGKDVFGRTLHHSMPQVVVSVKDFSARLAQNEAPASDLLEQLDRRAPVQVHQRPSLNNSYVAPRNDVERTLAEIWQELLGISEVGVDDNFFELGGDSLVSIQIVARANRVGLHLTPQQVFQHQTIAAMAAVAGTRKSIQAEQGLVTGPLPLTPIQHWFFEKESPEPHHFNQAVLLEVRGVLDPGLLDQSLRALVSHHDALRLRFVQWKSGWEQVNADLDESSLVAQTDLSSLAVENQRAAIESTAAEVQASLELSEGPTIRAMMFDLGAEESSRLLIVIHHLCVDGLSWRILLEDLQTVYQQLSKDQAVVLPSKTTSFKQWSNRLTEYAQSEAILGESGYWLAQASTRDTRLPRDFADGVNTQASRETVTVSLSAEETESLLQEVPAAYRTQINDVLLTALAQALSPWIGARSVAVDLEGHGREPIFEDIDLSRTVGWFTSLFPVHLQLEDGDDDPGRHLKSIKEQLRAIPTNGLSYGLLRYLRSDEEMTAKLRAASLPEISFLYLGQFDHAQSTVSMFGPAKESSGPNISPLANRSHLLEFSGSVSEGRLKLSLTYSRNVHRASTAERLAEDFVEALRALINHCRTTEAGGYTPSDFTEAGLSQEELDELIAELTSA
ncbi:MAG TPA: SDR family NAD(P)-dependent oxidoreductase [Pyrinomonadaceae bacterium]|nr:SDR family NAD(P)-dependent oxidoreductase [Pyrinomonadaceae bacterium]